nr:tRNA 2-thiocytidine(32) synthetase TtcA [Clostridia bacterium]
MQKILSYMRKAIDNYNMIEEGDKIAVGLSGGKDSTTMLMGLKNLQRFYPKKFEIIAITINPGFEGFDIVLLKDICRKIDVPLIIEDGHMKEIVFDIRNEKNPCSLCANLRRGMLNSIAAREGCTKIAIGHNEDDVLETFIMNLFYAGSINTFAPISYMDRSKMTLIRPLIYAPEKYIRNFVKRNNITIMPKACPMDGFSKREDIKELLKNLQTVIPHIRANLYGAIKRGEVNGFKEFK